MRKLLVLDILLIVEACLVPELPFSRPSKWMWRPYKKHSFWQKQQVGNKCLRILQKWLLLYLLIFWPFNHCLRWEKLFDLFLDTASQKCYKIVATLEENYLTCWRREDWECNFRQVEDMHFWITFRYCPKIYLMSQTECMMLCILDTGWICKNEGPMGLRV